MSQVELARVLRRAADLDAQRELPVSTDHIDPTAVLEAAAEVGLSREAVQRALHEVMHPDETAPDLYAHGRLPARELILQREVPGEPEGVEERVGRYLRRQLFVQQRVFADGSRWGPRKGVVANVRRGVDPGGRLVLNQIRCVQVTVSRIDVADRQPATLVRVWLDLTEVRNIHATWLGAGGAVGVGAVAGTTAIVGVDPLVLLAVPLAGGTTIGGHLVGRWQTRTEVEKIHTAVAGLLDRLEHGDRVVSRSGRSRPSGRRRHRAETPDRPQEETPDESQEETS